MFKETEKKLFVIVKNDEKGRPKFYANGKGYGMVSGIVTWVKTEVKDIVPTKGDNVGKTITVHNLLVNMVSIDWEFELQLPLYSGLARAAMNALAGGYAGEEVFFSVYNNKKGFRAMSVRNSEEKEDYVTPYYNREQELGMVEEKKVKWVLKKDYDALSDTYVKELLPIIMKKLGTGEKTTEEQPATEDDDTIPF